MNRKIFFTAVRRAPFAGRMTQAQVDGINRILDEWDKRGLTDLRWLSYMLASVFHETAHKMQPIREMGGEAYLKSKKYYPWVGEGLIQVTWEANAKKFGAKKPGDLLSWPIALVALFDGMIKGMFTGKKLADYFNDKKTDWVNARRIVNGTDRAALIAGYAQEFHDALQAAQTGDVPAQPDSGNGDIIPPQPPPKAPVGPAAAGGGILGAIVAGGTAVQAGAPVWAVALAAATVLALVAAGIWWVKRK